MCAALQLAERVAPTPARYASLLEEALFQPHIAGDAAGGRTLAAGLLDALLHCCTAGCTGCTGNSGRWSTMMRATEQLVCGLCAGRSRTWALLAAALRQQVPSTSLPVLQQLQALLGRWAPPRALQQELEGLLRATCSELHERQVREHRCASMGAREAWEPLAAEVCTCMHSAARMSALVLHGQPGAPLPCSAPAPGRCLPPTTAPRSCWRRFWRSLPPRAAGSCRRST